MKQQPGLADHVFMGIILILATLTRESATLILATYFAIHYKSILQNPLNANSKQIVLLTMTLLFLLTYWALRWQLGMQDATHKSIRLLQNFSDDPLPIIGTIFFPAVLSLFFTDNKARKHMKVFLIAATPYWLAMLFVAYPWEIRLWIPIIIIMVFLKISHASLPEEEKTA